MSFLQSIPVNETSSVQVAVRVRPINDRESNSEVITSTRCNTIYISNPEDRKKKNFAFDYAYDLSSTQEQVYNDIGEKVISNAFMGYNSCVFAYGQTGCFAKDTQVMLYSGKYKAVQDITLDDTIMGDDSTPRKVLKLFQGTQNMYKIKPNLDGYQEYTVNEDHIMLFETRAFPRYDWYKSRNTWRVTWYDIPSKQRKQTSFKPTDLTEDAIREAEQEALEFIKNLDDTPKIVEMDIKQYLKLRGWQRKQYACYTTGVDFSEEKVELDPYFLGMWLGDGTSSNTQITSIDSPIIEYVGGMAEKYDCHVSKNGEAYTIARNIDVGHGKTNPIRELLRVYNVFNNKHIPDAYKYNSRDVRLKVLAGLIDTDGHYDTSNHSYEITQKNKVLADDIIYLARSLGFYASINKCMKGCMYKGEMRNGTYYRCYINGTNLYEIPVLLDRKKARREKTKNFKTFLPVVESLGKGDYYGFMLDGNHRFVGAGFNVLRNSGKSHTMSGDSSNEINKGLIPRICQALFDRQETHNNIKKGECEISYRVELSYLEIYSEEVRDLMKKDNQSNSLKVRQHPTYGPYVEGLSQLVIEDFKSIKRLIDQGNKERITASTLMNSRSSRSHAILTIYFTQIIQESGIDKAREVVSKINLVDLAGSERVDASGVTGINFKEAININKSLSTLGLVITKLATQSTQNQERNGNNGSENKSPANSPTNSISSVVSSSSVTKNKLLSIKEKPSLVRKSSSKSPTTGNTSSSKNTSTNTSSNRTPTKNKATPSIAEHIPFRDSVLTWILKESLGGNSKTYMLATISPAAINYSESLSTLRYAYNAKQIVNNVKINEDPNDKIIRILKSEIDILREKLKNSSGTATSAEVNQLREELLQREELIREKEKSWEQKLEDSKRIDKVVQEQMRNEIALKQAEFRKKLEFMHNENESLLSEMAQMKSSLSDKELQQQKIIEDELLKAQREYERKQENFEKGRIVETAVSLQQYYDNKLKELQSSYEEKLLQRDKRDSKETIDEIEKLKQYSQQLKDNLSKSQRDLQVQMRQFTNDRSVLSKQIQQLQSKIHTLEHDMKESSSHTLHTDADVAQKTQEYNFIKQKRDEEEHKYNLLQAEFQALDKRIESDKALLETLDKKHATILEEMELNTKTLLNIKHEYATLREKFEADKDEYNNLLVRKEILHTEIVNLKTSLDLHIGRARIQLKNPTIDDLLKIKDGFEAIFNNIKSTTLDE